MGLLIFVDLIFVIDQAVKFTPKKNQTNNNNQLH